MCPSGESSVGSFGPSIKAGGQETCGESFTDRTRVSHIDVIVSNPVRQQSRLLAAGAAVGSDSSIRCDPKHTVSTSRASRTCMRYTRFCTNGTMHAPMSVKACRTHTAQCREIPAKETQFEVGGFHRIRAAAFHRSCKMGCKVGSPVAQALSVKRVCASRMPRPQRHHYPALWAVAEESLLQAGECSCRRCANIMLKGAQPTALQ